MGSKRDQAVALLRRSLVWDNVWPLEPECGNTFESLNVHLTAGFNVVSITIAGDKHNVSEAMQRTAAARRSILAAPDKFRLVESIGDASAAQAEGTLGIVLHFEGTRCFERNLDTIEAFYKLGVRHTLLAFNVANSVGGGCTDAMDAGLTKFGRRVVQEMQRVGMVLDLSHTGRKTCMDAMEIADRPCIFSHSNVLKVTPHCRNVDDEQIRACASTGGLIGISGSSEYLGDRDCGVETLFRHVDYIASLVGAEHVGLGLDIVNDADAVTAYCKSRPDEWPFAAAPEWNGFRYAPASRVVDLVEVMLEHGYDTKAVEGVLAGNLVRVCSAVWR
jgi:membrane dipeptidase